MSLPAIREILTAVDQGARADQALAQIAGPHTRLDGPTRKATHEGAMALFRWRGWLGKEIAADLARAVDLARGLDAQVREAGPAGGPSALEKAAAWLAAQTQRSAARMDPWALFPTWLVDELPAAPEGKDPALHDLPLLAALQRRAPLWIRAQGPEADALPARLGEEGHSLRAHPRLPRAYEVLSSGDVYRTKAFHEGRFEVQDLASQAVAAACEAQKGERVWDVCAGAGGKTLALADRMGGKGAILATDTHDGRLTELKRRARRGDVQNARALLWNGEGVPRTGKKSGFDCALVDAPCSGSGTWRRNPEARANTGKDDLARLAALQAKILAIAARGVRPGGRLVYATCSLARSEDEAVVDAFLASSPQYALEPFAHPLTGATTSGALRISPAEEGCDGDAMFVARMRRRKDAPPAKARSAGAPADAARPAPAENP